VFFPIFLDDIEKSLDYFLFARIVNAVNPLLYHYSSKLKFWMRGEIWELFFVKLVEKF